MTRTIMSIAESRKPGLKSGALMADVPVQPAPEAIENQVILSEAEGLPRTVTGLLERTTA